VVPEALRCGMTDPDRGGRTFLVACLCADWCHACRQYRRTFDALAHENRGSADFVWVDIDDDERVLGSVDIVDFPTLLIAQGDRIVFFGPVTPYLGTARQLLRRALGGELGMRYEPSLVDLQARLRTLNQVTARSAS
jgi:thioredoxin 1